ncbi:MAG: hypothetical protein Q4F18_05825 [Clostridia bacterium]|nr:hypothetical protein [Clostridia bacterium]
MNNMKKWMLAWMLVPALFALSGCGAVEQALRKVGQDMQDAQVETPQNNGGDIDWSFVPVVREMATATFTEGFPNAEITETSVASKNGGSDRVIVTLTYSMDGKTGTYGFDYEKNGDGEYELKRYGDGVSSDDL